MMDQSPSVTAAAPPAAAAAPPTSSSPPKSSSRTTQALAIRSIRRQRLGNRSRSRSRNYRSASPASSPQEREGATTISPVSKECQEGEASEKEALPAPSATPQNQSFTERTLTPKSLDFDKGETDRTSETKTPTGSQFQTLGDAHELISTHARGSQPSPTKVISTTLSLDSTMSVSPTLSQDERIAFGEEEVTSTGGDSGGPHGVGSGDSHSDVLAAHTSEEKSSTPVPLRHLGEAEIQPLDQRNTSPEEEKEDVEEEVPSNQENDNCTQENETDGTTTAIVSLENAKDCELDSKREDRTVREESNCKPNDCSNGDANTVEAFSESDQHQLLPTNVELFTTQEEETTEDGESSSSTNADPIPVILNKSDDVEHRIEGHDSRKKDDVAINIHDPACDDKDNLEKMAVDESDNDVKDVSIRQDHPINEQESIGNEDIIENEQFDCIKDGIQVTDLNQHSNEEIAQDDRSNTNNSTDSVNIDQHDEMKLQITKPQDSSPLINARDPSQESEGEVLETLSENYETKCQRYDTRNVFDAPPSPMSHGAKSDEASANGDTSSNEEHTLNIEAQNECVPASSPPTDESDVSKSDQHEVNLESNCSEVGKKAPQNFEFSDNIHLLQDMESSSSSTNVRKSDEELKKAEIDQLNRIALYTRSIPDTASSSSADVGDEDDTENDECQSVIDDNQYQNLCNDEVDDQNDEFDSPTNFFDASAKSHSLFRDGVAQDRGNEVSTKFLDFPSFNLTSHHNSGGNILSSKNENPNQSQIPMQEEINITFPPFDEVDDQISNDVQESNDIFVVNTIMEKTESDASSTSVIAPISVKNQTEIESHFTAMNSITEIAGRGQQNFQETLNDLISVTSETSDGDFYFSVGQQHDFEASPIPSHSLTVVSQQHLLMPPPPPPPPPRNEKNMQKNSAITVETSSMKPKQIQTSNLEVGIQPIEQSEDKVNKLKAFKPNIPLLQPPPDEKLQAYLSSRPSMNFQVSPKNLSMTTDSNPTNSEESMSLCHENYDTNKGQLDKNLHVSQDISDSNENSDGKCNDFVSSSLATDEIPSDRDNQICNVEPQKLSLPLHSKLISSEEDIEKPCITIIAMPSQDNEEDKKVNSLNKEVTAPITRLRVPSQENIKKYLLAKPSFGELHRAFSDNSLILDEDTQTGEAPVETKFDYHLSPIKSFQSPVTFHSEVEECNKSSAFGEHMDDDELMELRSTSSIFRRSKEQDRLDVPHKSVYRSPRRELSLASSSNSFQHGDDLAATIKSSLSSSFGTPHARMAEKIAVVSSTAEKKFNELMISLSESKGAGDDELPALSSPYLRFNQRLEDQSSPILQTQPMHLAGGALIRSPIDEEIESIVLQDSSSSDESIERDVSKLLFHDNDELEAQPVQNNLDNHQNLEEDNKEIEPVELYECHNPINDERVEENHEPITENFGDQSDFDTKDTNVDFVDRTSTSDVFEKEPNKIPYGSEKIGLLLDWVGNQILQCSNKEVQHSSQGEENDFQCLRTLLSRNENINKLCKYVTDNVQKRKEGKGTESNILAKSFLPEQSDCGSSDTKSFAFENAAVALLGGTQKLQPFSIPCSTKIPSTTLAANFVSFLHKVSFLTAIDSPIKSNIFLEEIVSTSLNSSMSPTQKEKDFQVLLFDTDDESMGMIAILDFLREASSQNDVYVVNESLDQISDGDEVSLEEENSINISRRLEPVIEASPDVSGNIEKTCLESPNSMAPRHAYLYEKAPESSPSPFELSIWNVPSIVVLVLTCLGDPVAVCRMKMVNTFCYRLISENEYVIMKDSVRIGGINMHQRPAFWLWLTLERCENLKRNKPDSRSFEELESAGRESKWYNVINRDVTRAFGNMPPHKSGDRQKNNSIVRALLAWGSNHFLKRDESDGTCRIVPMDNDDVHDSDNERPIRRLTMSPPSWVKKSLKESAKRKERDPGAEFPSLEKTDTVSDWSGVSPTGSTISTGANKIPSQSGSGSIAEQETALGGNGLTIETKLDLQNKLESILNAIAAAHETVGYCQGMDYVVAHSLRILQHTIEWNSERNRLPAVIRSAQRKTFNGRDENIVVKEAVFRVMDTFLSTYNLRYMYWPELRCLKTCCRIFEKIVQKKLPVLSDHFDYHDLNIGMFALGWFQTLFLYIPSMPSATINHMWDIWLVERSMKIFFRVATAILFLSQPILLNQELEGMMHYLNTFPDPTLFNPHILITCALQIKITNKMLTKIESEVVRESELSHGWDHDDIEEKYGAIH